MPFLSFQLFPLTSPKSLNYIEISNTDEKVNTNKENVLFYLYVLIPLYLRILNI